MALNENEIVKLNDGNKYWILKKLDIHDIVFYYTLKLGTTDTVVFAEAEELEIVQDEEILKIVLMEVRNQFPS